jgi:aspartyl-tRNA(Asn)/glutamyl-tRNA(Gln) amidotransferase subunit B
VVQETRLWDAAQKRTVSMRGKEEAHDYRYFPEPDLPPLLVDPARLARLRAELPELPATRRRRLAGQYALTMGDAVALSQVGLAAYFEDVVRHGADPKAAKNWLLGAVRARMNEEGQTDPGWLRQRLDPARLAGLLALVANGTISGSIAKDVFERMFESGRSADEIVTAEGLTQIDDDSHIAGIIAEVMRQHGDAIAQYRAGKATALGFLVGQVMKATSGKANPKRVNELLRARLEV